MATIKTDTNKMSNSDLLNAAVEEARKTLQGVFSAKDKMARGFAVTLGCTWTLRTTLGHITDEELSAWVQAFHGSNKSEDELTRDDATLEALAKLGISNAFKRPDEVNKKLVSADEYKRYEQAYERWSKAFASVRTIVIDAMTCCQFLEKHWKSRVEVLNKDTNGKGADKQVKGCLLVPKAALNPDEQGSVNIVPYGKFNTQLIQAARKSVGVVTRKRNKPSASGVSVDGAIKTLASMVKDEERAVQSQALIITAMQAVTQGLLNVIPAKQTAEYKVAARELVYAAIQTSHGWFAKELTDQVLANLEAGINKDKNSNKDAPQEPIKTIKDAMQRQMDKSNKEVADKRKEEEKVE